MPVGVYSDGSLVHFGHTVIAGAGIVVPGLVRENRNLDIIFKIRRSNADKAMQEAMEMDTVQCDDASSMHVGVRFE